MLASRSFFIVLPKAPARGRGFEFYPLVVGSVFRAYRSLAPIKPVIEANRDGLNAFLDALDDAPRRKGDISLAQAIVIVFNSTGPIWREREFIADADGPSRSRLRSASVEHTGKGVHDILVVGPCAARPYIKKRGVPSISETTRETCNRINFRGAIEQRILASSGSLKLAPVPIRFNAEYRLA